MTTLTAPIPAKSRAHAAVPRHVAVSHRAARTRSSWSYIGAGIGNLLAAGGVVAVGLVIAAITMNISLIMFKTGSMSPTAIARSASD